jgi:hypothetical protein
MGFFDDIISGLGGLFGGGGGGGTDLSSFIEPAATGVSDVGSTASDLGGNFGGLDLANGINIAGANDAFTGPSASGTPTSMPAGLPPALATVGGVAPGEAQAAPSSPFGQTDPEQLARQGTLNPSESAGGSVGSTKLAPPPPTAWESVKNSPGKWWDSVSTSAANEFNKAPIATTAKVGALAAPIIGAGISALNAPKQPGKYTLNPPATPASAQAGSDTMPVASPMSTTLTGQGGFNVRPGQGFAQGGQVGVSDQDKADYEEAMRQFKGQPAQPAQKNDGYDWQRNGNGALKGVRSYQDQLDDADKGKQQKPSSYFRPWSK